MPGTAIRFAVLLLSIQSLQSSQTGGNDGTEERRNEVIDWTTYEVPANVKTKLNMNSCQQDIQEKSRAFEAYDDWIKKYGDSAEGCTCSEIIEVYKFAERKNLIATNNNELIQRLYWISCGRYQKIIEFQKRPISSLLAEINDADQEIIYLLANYREILGQYVGGKDPDSNWSLKVVVDELNVQKNKVNQECIAFKASFQNKIADPAKAAEAEQSREPLLNGWTYQYYRMIFASIQFCLERKLETEFFRQIVDQTKFVGNSSVVKSSFIESFLKNEEAKKYIEGNINKFPVLLNNLTYIFFDKYFYQGDLQAIVIEQEILKFVKEFFEETSKKPDLHFDLASKLIRTFCGISMKRFKEYCMERGKANAETSQGNGAGDGSGGGKEDENTNTSAPTQQPNYIGYIHDFKELTASTTEQYILTKEKDALLIYTIQKKDPNSETMVDVETLECR